MKRTIYLISFLLCFLFSLMCLSAALTGINNGANIGSLVILGILCGIFLLTGIFLCRKHNMQSKPDNSEFNIKVKEYHEKFRPLNWFNWQVAILPFGVVLSIMTICGNILSASATFEEPYKTATYLLTILDVATVVFAIRAIAYAKHLTLKSYKCFMAYYIYLPFPLLIAAITYIFLTLDKAENIAAMVVGDYLGRFIGLAIFSMLSVVYFKKRKNLFAENDFIKSHEEVKNGQQLSLFSVDEKTTSTVENKTINDAVNETVNDTMNTPIPVAEKKRYCKYCGGLIQSDTKKCVGCGKQYFKRPNNNKILCVMVFIFIATSTIILGVLYQNEKENAEYWEEQYQEIYATYRFYNNNAVVVPNDDSGLFHKYKCENCDTSSYWIFNKEAAEAKGYTPCSKCFVKGGLNVKSLYD